MAWTLSFLTIFRLLRKSALSSDFLVLALNLLSYLETFFRAGLTLELSIHFCSSQGNSQFSTEVVDFDVQLVDCGVLGLDDVVDFPFLLLQFADTVEHVLVDGEKLV